MKIYNSFVSISLRLVSDDLIDDKSTMVKLKSIMAEFIDTYTVCVARHRVYHSSQWIVKYTFSDAFSIMRTLSDYLAPIYNICVASTQWKQMNFTKTKIIYMEKQYCSRWNVLDHSILLYKERIYRLKLSQNALMCWRIVPGVISDHIAVISGLSLVQRIIVYLSNTAWHRYFAWLWEDLSLNPMGLLPDT